MFSAALYARVQLFMHDFAHETAGAARIRHSLLPRLRDNDTQTSGKSCRENADVYQVLEIETEMYPRHCERSEGNPSTTRYAAKWIASLRSQ